MTASLEAGASAVVMITCRRTHQTMDRRKTVKHASSSSALTLPLWVMLLQVTVAENWKRDFAQLYKTQASRGGLTPPPTCHTSARWLSRTEDAAGRQQKGFPMITRRNCLIGASAALIGAPAIVEPETSWRSAVCRFNAPTMAFAIGYESIAFSAWKIAGWRPDPRSRRRTSTSHTAGEPRL